jgi:hypothetical protein
MLLLALLCLLTGGEVSHSGRTRETHVSVLEKDLFGELSVFFQDKCIERRGDQQDLPNPEGHQVVKTANLELLAILHRQTTP